MAVWARLERRAQQVVMVCRVMKDRPVSRDFREKWDREDSLAFGDSLDHRAVRAYLVQRVRRAIRGMLVAKVRPDRQVRLAQLVR